MSTLSLVIKSDRADLTDRLIKGEHATTLQEVQNYIKAIRAGQENCTSFDIHIASASPVAASGTITLASCAADDTVTIGGVTFTAKASPSGEAEFSQAGSDTADAAALAAKINAHSTLAAVVVATSAAGVVTVTSRVKGVIGNFITLAETGSTITVGAAALAGGTGGPSGTPTNYSIA